MNGIVWLVESLGLFPETLDGLIWWLVAAEIWLELSAFVGDSAPVFTHGAAVGAVIMCLVSQRSRHWTIGQWARVARQ